MNTSGLVDDCIFCRIAAAKAEASVVYRSESVTAFMDLSPVAKGHTLIVPNYHSVGLEGVSETAGGQLFATGRRIAMAMRNSPLECEGVNFFLADGKAAGQTVFHVHLHVIPRRRGDGFGIRTATLGRDHPDRNALDEQAGWIAAALGSA